MLFSDTRVLGLFTETGGGVLKTHYSGFFRSSARLKYSSWGVYGSYTSPPIACMTFC